MPCHPLYTKLAALSKLMISGISGRFRGYSPRFLGPGRISMPCDPGYTNLAASSKLVISGIFGRFRGL